MRRIAFLAGCLSLPFLFHHLTLGFSPAKLHPRLSCTIPNQKNFAAPEKAVIAILQQPFFYLARGSQTYVFESEDNRYVLKLFRYHRSQFSIVQNVKGWFHHPRTPLRIKMGKTFQAYAMAYQDLSEWTQILYLHLDPGDHSPHLPFLHLTDPMGRKWKLPLDAYPFALQRKAEPLQDALLRAAPFPEEMHSLLNSFVALLVARTEKSIRNSDHNLWPNFGVFEGKVVEIDCGNFRGKPSLANPQARIEEIERFIKPLHAWLLKHAPAYAPYLQEHIDSLNQHMVSTEGAEPLN